jgi:hypothetical protein
MAAVAEYICYHPSEFNASLAPPECHICKDKSFCNPVLSSCCGSCLDEMASGGGFAYTMRALEIGFDGATAAAEVANSTTLAAAGEASASAVAAGATAAMELEFAGHGGASVGAKGMVWNPYLLASQSWSTNGKCVTGGAVTESNKQCTRYQGEQDWNPLSMNSDLNFLRLLACVPSGSLHWIQSVAETKTMDKITTIPALGEVCGAITTDAGKKCWDTYEDLPFVVEIMVGAIDLLSTIRSAYTQHAVYKLCTPRYALYTHTTRRLHSLYTHHALTMHHALAKAIRPLYALR